MNKEWIKSKTHQLIIYHDTCFQMAKWLWSSSRIVLFSTVGYLVLPLFCFFFILVARFSFSCCWWWFGIQVIWHPWNFFHWQTNKTKQNKNDDDNDDIIPSEIGYFLSLFLQRSMLVHCVVGKRLHAHTHIYRLFADLNIFFRIRFCGHTHTDTHTHTWYSWYPSKQWNFTFPFFFFVFFFVYSFVSSLRFIDIISSFFLLF